MARYLRINRGPSPSRNRFKYQPSQPNVYNEGASNTWRAFNTRILPLKIIPDTILYSNAQADIKATGFLFGQAQAFIKGTRFYFPSTGSSPISTAYDAEWDKTSEATSRTLESQRTNSALTEQTCSENTATTPFDVAVGQFISAPLNGAQTISGNIRGIIQARESNIAADFQAQTIIRIVSNDGSTVRGTLIAADTSGLSNEFTTTTTNTKFPKAWTGTGTTVTNVNAQNGDRIVVEIGIRSLNNVTTNRIATFKFGDPTDSTLDADENEIDTASFVPWIEFEHVLFFQNEVARISQDVIQTLLLPDDAEVRISQDIVQILWLPDVDITHYIHAQAQADIKSTNFLFSQAQADIKQTGYLFAQAQALILGTSYLYAQAQADIKTTGFLFSQANADIKALRFMHAQAQALITRVVFIHAQAQADIKATDYLFGQAQATIKKTSLLFAQAQGFIRGKILFAQAQGTIVNNNIPQPQVQPSGSRVAQKYGVKYNGYELPGYVQEEDTSSVALIADHQALYADMSRSEYTGLSNKPYKLRMKIWECDYDTAKATVQRAATYLRSSRDGFARLEIMYRDRYYAALVETIEAPKDISTSVKTREYVASFEVKPTLFATSGYTLTGTGLVTTDAVDRTIADGIWTPIQLDVSGTNITISGYTDTQQTGFISISGTVTNMLIDTEIYTATMGGISVINRMMWVDFGLWVGPGKTYFDINGASSCTITYRNRWAI